MPKTIVRAKPTKQKELDELATLKQLLSFDFKQRFPGRSKKPACHLVGVDEVGRGCLAGPVVAAAVMLPDIDQGSSLAHSLKDLNDSKKLTAIQRERLAEIILSISDWTIDQASVEEIDEINILNASFLAMKRALDRLCERLPNKYPTLVLVDGNRVVKNLEQIQTPVIQGDGQSASIAAASIIAKVHRDRLMKELAGHFPQFKWEQNKGYGSRAHRDAIRSTGVTVWHRRIFVQKIWDTSAGDDAASDDADCDD